MTKSLWMLLASFLFALMAVFTKLGASDFGIFELVFYRSLCGVSCILVWSRLRHMRLATANVRSHFLRSFLGTFALTIWTFSLAHLPLGTSMTLNYTSPLFMTLIVIGLALRQRKAVSLKTAAAVFLGFFGVTLVLNPELRSGQELPALVGLCSGLFSALAYFQIKQLSAMREPEWRIVFYFTLFGTVFGLLGCELLEGGLHMPNTTGLIGILGMGLCATLGQICTTRSYAYGNMLLSSCLGFSAIPFSALISYFWFGEAASTVALAGMSLILVSGMTASVCTKRAEAADRAEAEKAAKTAEPARP